jgi:pimeloyl-ACP methyl ester carboxylesterase
MMGLCLGAVIAAILLITLTAFLLWRRRVLAQVLHGSQLAGTAKGPVEYSLVGAGPVILQLHGGAAGYDQTLALSWNLHESGFTVLTPSRPGYLRTPLTTGSTPEEAADAVAGLLDVLSIERVCVMGTSGGGPTALQFALRHPRRVWGLVFQSAISQRFVEPRRSTHSLIGRVVFSRKKWLADFGAWGAYLVARCWPRLLIRSLLNASDELPRAKAKERLSYVLRHPDQMSFFRRVAASGMPLSVRQTGLKNDLHQFAGLPVYPLERLTCPTLVVHGRADGNVPLAHAEFVAGTIPNAELFAMEDCGHFIWAGPGAAQYHEQVRSFLRRHAPPAPAGEARR